MNIAPSILAADMADLAGALQICEAGGADMVHVDVMDGHFVPNLSFGIPVLAALDRRSDLTMDLHLMVSNPAALMDQYLAAGADRVAFHWEAEVHPHRLCGRIREAGAKAGIAINPATPVEHLVDLLDELDFVLLMSVNPGFGGQAFIPRVLDKARRLRGMADQVGRDLEIEVDGGVDLTNVAALAAAGVHTSVVGSALFGSEDPVAMIGRLKRTAEDTE